jgi:hypothetical protein
VGLGDRKELPEVVLGLTDDGVERRAAVADLEDRGAGPRERQQVLARSIEHGQRERRRTGREVPGALEHAPHVLGRTAERHPVRAGPGGPGPSVPAAGYGRRKMDGERHAEVTGCGRGVPADPVRDGFGAEATKEMRKIQASTWSTTSRGPTIWWRAPRPTTSAASASWWTRSRGCGHHPDDDLPDPQDVSLRAAGIVRAWT